MKHLLLTTIAAVLASSLVSINVNAEPRVINSSTISDFFDVAFNTQKQDHELVGMVVSVVHKGKVIFKKGYGFADLEKRIPADPDKHLFRIASISKTFIWTAVMQLVEQGKLDLNEDIQAYLDFDIPKTYDEPIRLKHLLTHTPGFEDHVLGGAREYKDLQPLREFLANHVPARVRKPGTHIAYSNYGSAVAGYIVERESGMPWDEYVQKELLAPLGMTETIAHQLVSSAHKEAHAKGYRYEDGEFSASPYYYLSDSPAGAMSSTAANMANWLLVHLNRGELNGHRILKENTARQMQSELFRQHPEVNPMLHGFFQDQRNGVTTIGHGGALNQFYSDFNLFPEHDLGIFVCHNSDPGSAANWHIIPAFIDHFFSPEYPESLTPNKNIKLDDYVGDYAPTRRVYSTILRVGIMMFGAQINQSGEGELLLFGKRWLAIEKDFFRGKHSNTKLLFQRNEDGAVSHFFLSNGEVFERLAWHEAPGLHLKLIAATAVAALLYLIGFCWRLFKPDVSSSILPARDRWLGALLGILVLYFFYRSFLIFNMNLEEFIFGIPSEFKYTIALAHVFVALTLLSIVLVILQWRNSSGSLMARLRYGAFTICNLLLVVVLWYWNGLSYYFT